MKNNLQSLLLTGVISSILTFGSAAALSEPAWTLPDNGIKVSVSEKQAYIKQGMADYVKGITRSTRAFYLPDGWKHEALNIDGTKAERIIRPSAGSDRVFLQLHGGGYILPLTKSYRNLGVKQAVLSDAKSVYLVDYRLSPKYTFPYALQDAFAVYQYILNSGVKPEDIVVFGDSAGGNLALALSLYLKEKSLPQPAMLILASPWASIESDLPSRTENAPKDLICGSSNPIMYHEVQNPGYPGKYPAGHPLLSPVNGDLEGLPPMLIQAGANEIFTDDCRKLFDRALADGVKATLTVYPNMSHDFALVDPELQESIESFREIKAFIENN
ncbi:MAG: alpha/beta hydrolase [Succinivibrio sp.]|nr:alpha/beta hydrolase [Succinivibrio sp.]